MRDGEPGRGRKAGRDVGGAVTAAERGAAAGGTVLSMTGYGAAERSDGGTTLRMRLRSVNHRYLDLQLRLPAELDAAQGKLEQRLKAAIGRGHVELTVTVERAGGGPAGVDEEMAAAYVRAWRGLAAALNLPAAAPEGLAWELLKMPGVLAGRAPVDGGEQLEKIAAGALEACLAEHRRSREREGAAMAADLRERLEAIAAAAGVIGRLRAGAEAAYAARLRGRMEALLAASGAALAPERLAQEAALWAERSDISEELVRLEAHRAEFAEILAAGGEVGKKLDFLLQEMQREANTLLSKTSGLAAEALEVTRQGLAIKAAIEKIREQVQNLS